MVSTTPNIPDEGYFGISAATGGLSDDHDVMSFIVHSLHPLDEGKEATEGNTKEYQERFDQYAEELTKKRGTPSKQPSDHVNVYQNSFEHEFSYEADWERNLRQILEAQYDVNCAVKILQDKTDQIINTLLVASPSAGGGALPAGMREELTSIKNTRSLVQHQLGDLREYLEKNQAKRGMTSEALQPIYELKHVAERSSKSSEEVLAKLSTLTQLSSCPPPPVCQSCVTIVQLTILASVQVVILLVYNWYRQRQESAAKKFF
ncbi:protein ERGIC-53-like isoform X1 [Dysidea avara]|uniref:protein ERGIC-53-like isoform X1 n=1 Tax=Dysidea avara TaxID=196820 RepID=UPI0033331E61